VEAGDGDESDDSARDDDVNADDDGDTDENECTGGGVATISRSPSVMEERDTNDDWGESTLLLNISLSTTSSANAVFIAAFNHWHNPS